MSIKKLFDNPDSSRHYLTSTDERELFQDVESARNAEAIQERQDTYQPQIDYSTPDVFARYGSAYLYYRGAFERISDFYPYDGSDAEINEFRNKANGVDRYIFDHVYPRTTGYAIISPNTTASADGYGNTTVVGNGAADDPLGDDSWYGLPTTQEYITFEGGPGTGSFASGSSLVTLSPDPHSSKFQHANIYDEDIYRTEGLPFDYGSGSRESNLKTNLNTHGITIEFWMKTGSYDDWDSDTSGFANTKTGKQVIFDMWNNETTGSADYGRITLELTGGSVNPGQWDLSPFTLTVQSGTAGIYNQRVGGDSNNPILSSSIGEWNHWAFRLYNTASLGVNRLHIETYLNGALHDLSTLLADACGELYPKNMQARLGALLTAPSGNAELAGLAPSAYSGAGKLSASLDEFRFWKAKRSPREIGLHWFDQVRGGVNTDIHNTELGVYYKFNEGITGVHDIDNIVLDYGGRIANGYWKGYSSFSRNTGSAMVSASAATVEYEDPIIYEVHPAVSSSKMEFLDLGDYHDLNNTSLFKNYMPAWILDEHENTKENNLDYLSHIFGSYFDSVFFQIASLPVIKTGVYPTGSAKPTPFARHLPQSLGLYTPELFINADIMEKFLYRSEDKQFAGSLDETKNLIYTNLYNNLAHIFKSKGTEKAIRNLLRCFNLDENVLRLNAYARRQTFELKNNLKQELISKPEIRFNQVNNLNAVIYQRQDPTNTGETLGYLSGSNGAGKSGAHILPYEAPYGATAEVDVTFPRIDSTYDSFDRGYRKVSIFGCHTADTGSADSLTGEDTGIIAEDFANFEVLAIKPNPSSKNLSFKLTASAPFADIELTSSQFFNVYDAQRWNVSVRIKPSTPYAGMIDGATAAGYGSDYGYNLIFRGTNAGIESIKEQFVLTASLTKEEGENFLTATKRFYVGAKRANITGAVQVPCDLYFDSLKYWARSLDDWSLGQHLHDYDNYGISKIYQNISALDTNNDNLDIVNREMLALNWNFENVTASDSTGNFYVTDMSSGSTEYRTHYGWLGNLVGYQHSGYGYGFVTSSAEVIEKRLVNTFKFINPERVISSQMVNILSDDDRVYEAEQMVPDFYYTLEKSLYNAISEEILDFFAGVIDFNNLIGEPVNRYRERYKAMEKLREAFFRRVTKVSTVEKYLEYFKWFDDALSTIIGQLMALSTEYLDDSLNMIESHVLERNKYKTQYPTIEFVIPNLDTALEGIKAGTYDWKYGHSVRPSSPRSQKVKGEFWKFRALRTCTELTALNEWPTDSALADTIDSQKETIRKTITSVPRLSASYPSRFTMGGVAYEDRKYANRNFVKLYEQKTDINKAIRGGPNFEYDKNISFIYDAVRPAGPINLQDGVYVPQNVLIGFTEDLVKLQELEMLDANPTGKKIKRTIKVQHGRDWEDGLGYNNVKSSMAFPFSIYSSSVKSGYNKSVIDRVTASIEITNLHNDIYGPDLEIPLQGPFTNYAVGGHQSRHVKLNRGNDTWYNRPEAWKLLLGKCPNTSGAIGLVGPDYPWPKANEEGVAPYPMTGSQKAWLYRDFVAKRPVNIRNILITSGSDGVSTVLGNYYNNYEVINTVGARSNPRWFVDHQPGLPVRIFGNKNLTSSNVVANYLVLNSQGHPYEPYHFNYELDYLVTDNSSSSDINKTVIASRFGAPGGRDTTQRSFRDIRGNEMSVYNTLGLRHLGLLKISQAPTGAVPTASVGIRVVDDAGQDFGLYAHAARHTARFGRDSMLVPNPGASYHQIPNFHKVHRNNITVPQQECTLVYDTSDVDLPDWRNTCTLAPRQIYDNLNVSHMIPRMDRQYAWVTASLHDASDYRYYGRAPIYGIFSGLYSSSVGGWESYFTFVTASQIVSQYTPGLKQTTTRLNILTTDPVSSSDNKMGYPLEIAYNPLYNTNELMTDLNPDVSPDDWYSGSANYLNLLLTRRGATYGWTWQATRQQNHPILLKEKEDNTITVADTADTYALSRYRFPPVSMRGRPVLANYANAGPTSVTLKMTHNNEEIFFNETSFNDFVNISLDHIVTPYEQLIPIIVGDYDANWVLYTEALFPSLRNEFSSSVRGKPSYDNKFWRDNLGDRLTVGDSIPNSFGISVNQDCWPLSAQSNFLTRTDVPTITDEASMNNLRNQGRAGELQNNYFHYFKSADNNNIAMKALSPAGLYSRKQMITTWGSVVSPFGVRINATGAIPAGASQFAEIYQIDNYGGEAYWDAPAHAGIVESLDGNSIFVNKASRPWWNSYDAYSFDLKTLAKDYAVIPEFRISEHVEDYIRHGIFNEGITNTFSLPETGLNSATSSFYLDYSNSEFMTNFLKVKADTLMNATQIKLCVSAAVRFNPYKGFYPAQRTLDLVHQFSRSYGGSMTAEAFYPPSQVMSGSDAVINISGALSRPVAQCFVAPGVLYNTIKSGIAVEYPLITTNPSGLSASAQYFGDADNDEPAVDNYAMVIMGSGDTHARNSAEYWSTRIPFEAVINPKTIGTFTAPDFESHPSSSLNMTGTFGAAASDNIYNLMARNFFGEVPNFFLKNSTFSTLESQTVSDDLRFSSGSVYGCRLKIRKSYLGTKSYEYESGSGGSYVAVGGATWNAVNETYSATDGYPLPQWPILKPKADFQESFTMYSRPTAFGPAIAGRPWVTQASAQYDGKVRDSFNGHNPAYTPPYYDGEAWLDIIFRPVDSVDYDLEMILTEAQKASWRFDSGNGKSQLLYTNFAEFFGIYDGYRINPNSMQLSASINPFGIERVNFQETDKFGNVTAERDTTIGKKWIIKPKFETPMLNFCDVGVNPITGSSNLSVPNKYGASVPRGMWHQFGTIPADPETGIFLEIEDIPSDWLRYHPEVLLTASVYNNFDVNSGPSLYQNMGSLKDLVGFGKISSPKASGLARSFPSSVRLGELAESRTIREAIVAVPYVIESVRTTTPKSASASGLQQLRKKFINIPTTRYEAAMNFAKGTAVGDTLMTAGESIRKMVQKMERYIFPPQFDFINNPNLDPVVMYIFEFEHTFDKDDLAYIWQNLAPRDYEKITFEEESIAHELMDLELLNESDIMENENLRWMVFKVKQKGQSDYWDQVQSQIGEASGVGEFVFQGGLQQPFNRIKGTTNSTYSLRFNWPYDYVSFVELIKVDAQVLYKPAKSSISPMTSLDPDLLQTYMFETPTSVGSLYGSTASPTVSTEILTQYALSNHTPSSTTANILSKLEKLKK